MTTRSFGKYRIIAELGHGGMADVLLAIVAGPTGSGFAKLAVVKRLRPNLVEDPEFIAMLVDEARITARLNHPNVVQTQEVGVEGGEYYLAMEYLDGQPLHRIQRRAARTGTPVDAMLEYVIVLDALAGLHHAHELADYDGTPLSIIHRDVTPQNIFVTYDGTVKVVDFGIAKAAGRAAETKQGIVKGKVRYMSPEQAMGHDVDRRSDVFAAGILLWEAATKKRFWQDKDDLAIVQSLIAGDYDPSPRNVDESIPEEIDAFCRKALAREPDDRFASAAEFRTALEVFLADGVVAARRDLGPLVAEMFAKERRELRGIIEQVSKTTLERSATSASTTMPVPRLPAPSKTPSLTPSTSPFVVTRSSARPSSRPSREQDADVTELSLLGFIPRKKRFGVGAVVGAAMMLVSFLVAASVLQATGIASGSAALSVDRSPSSPVVDRHAIVLRSVEAKMLPVVAEAATAPAAGWAPPANAHHTTAPVVGATVTASIAPVAAPASTTGNGAPSRGDARRRRSLDTTDPWAPPQHTWAD